MSGRGELLVGVDVGTTMTKAAIVTPDGVEVAWGSVPTPWYPVPTGAEMGPLDILAAVGRAIGSALDVAPPGPVAGLAVTSMAETMALLGKNGEPVAPAIAWHDTRGQEEVGGLGPRVRRAHLFGPHRSGSLPYLHPRQAGVARPPPR